MKSVLISIQPKWCELIASEKKTVEVRKTKPKLETPFKVYIYCTKDKWQHLVQMPDKSYRIYNGKEYGKYDKSLIFGGEANGKVIGEFVCDRIFAADCDCVAPFDKNTKAYIDKESCISKAEFVKYTKMRLAFGWHISNLKIYDKPKELGEFYKEDFDEVLSNWEDLFSIGIPSGCSVEYPPEPKREDYIIKRPPQSWCYVED